MTDTPKLHRRYGFYLLVMVAGWILPPIAVLLRFGFGTDFFLNILLTLCGYIPGHGHNFYLQNIRNNHNRKRTPLWASRAGLVKDPTAKRKLKTQWANRYDERTPTRADGYQDDDDRTTNNNHSTQQQRLQSQGENLIEQHLLDPESLVGSSSTSSVEQTSLDSLDHRVNNSSTRSIQSSSNHSNLNKNHHPSLTSSNHLLHPTRNRNPTPSHSKKLNRHTYHNSTEKKKSSHWRKTFDPPTTTNLETPINQDDPYFIRRASTIHLTSSSNHKNQNLDRKSTIHSPTSVKSFPSKIGFSSKTHSPIPKNRHDSRPKGIGWDENSARTSPSYDPTTINPTQSSNNTNHLGNDDDDGLNHQF